MQGPEEQGTCVPTESAGSLFKPTGHLGSAYAVQIDRGLVRGRSLSLPGLLPYPPFLQDCWLWHPPRPQGAPPIGICIFRGTSGAQKPSSLPRRTSVLLELKEDCVPGEGDTMKLEDRVSPPFMGLGARRGQSRDGPVVEAARRRLWGGGFSAKGREEGDMRAESSVSCERTCIHLPSCLLAVVENLPGAGCSLSTSSPGRLVACPSRWQSWRGHSEPQPELPKVWPVPPSGLWAAGCLLGQWSLPQSCFTSPPTHGRAGLSQAGHPDQKLVVGPSWPSQETRKILLCTQDHRSETRAYYNLIWGNQESEPESTAPGSGLPHPTQPAYPTSHQTPWRTLYSALSGPCSCPDVPVTPQTPSSETDQPPRLSCFGLTSPYGSLLKSPLPI